MNEDDSKHESGYRVEYVPPYNVDEGLLDIFRNIQKELSSTELHNIIIETPQDIKDIGNNTYSYMIPFKNNKGYILFKYWDMVAEMESFEEFMHSERGELETSVSLQVSFLNGFKNINLDKVSFRKYSNKDRKDFGELVWTDSEYMWLSNSDSINYEELCNNILGIWNRLLQLEKDVQTSPEVNK